jgi:hypothetical protein
MIRDINRENKNLSDLQYPSKDDIYIHEKKELFSEEGDANADQSSPEDLDVPGADLDDPNERIGDEDEENNYYSIGGDDHADLEEQAE